MLVVPRDGKTICSGGQDNFDGKMVAPRTGQYVDILLMLDVVI